jgi:hypothetical protein
MKTIVKAGGVALAAAAGLAAGSKLAQAAGSVRAVGAGKPVLVLDRGQCQNLTAVLVHKPRWSFAFRQVDGELEFFGAGDAFSIAPDDATPGRKSIASPGAVTVLGLRAGESELRISGTSRTGDPHGEIEVPVIVVDPGTPLLDVFRRATAGMARTWRHGPWGGPLVNWFAGEWKGLCGHWADWMAEWVPARAMEELSKVEKAIYRGTFAGHECLRIFMSDGRVFYLDPYRNPADPVHAAADFEREYGRPDDCFIVWSR